MFLYKYGLLLCPWRDDKAPATSLDALPPQCKLICGYHYSFNVSWHKMSRWVLALSWRDMCQGGQGLLSHYSSWTPVLPWMCSLSSGLVGLERTWDTEGWWGTSIMSVCALPSQCIISGLESWVRNYKKIHKK